MGAKTRSAHRLIYEAFNGKVPIGKVVSHKDGNMYNNALSNLICETQKQNLSRRLEHGTDDRGFKNSRAKINEEQLAIINKLLEEGDMTHEAIGKFFGVSRVFITKIKNKYRYNMSVTFFQSALNALKKANKVRKVVLAKKAGYENVEDYQSFLEKSIKDTPVTAAPKIEKVEAEDKPSVRVKSPRKPKAVAADASVKEELTDLVIAFDTTGSMASYIAAVKKHVKELIPSLFKQNPNLKISIVAFGDYCDMDSKTEFGRAYQVTKLTNDANALIDFVTNAKNTSGGDYQEFYELVIKKITEETDWREGSNKSVLFIADATPHEIGYSYAGKVSKNTIDWRQEAMKANSRGIKFDTLRIEKSIDWYAELSQLTEGVCLDFKSSNKTADLVEATVLARGGATTANAFMTKSMSVEASNDTELKSVYAMYKTVNKK